MEKISFKDLPPNVQHQILSRTDLSTTASVCREWRNVVNTKIGRTVKLNYFNWVRMQQHDNKLHRSDVVELIHLKNLRDLSISATKFRLCCAPAPEDDKVDQLLHLLAFAANVTVATNVLMAPVFGLGVHLHSISGWWTGVTFPLGFVTWTFLCERISRRLITFHMRGLGLTNHHLLKSVSIEYPPSPILFSVILKNSTNLKHFHLMPQSLQNLKPEEVKSIRIPTLTSLSLPICLNEFQGRIPKREMALVFLNNNHFPALKSLRMDLGVLSHQNPLVGEPIPIDSVKTLELITAALGFIAKHDGLEELVCPQSFLECDARFEGLSFAQRFVRFVPGAYCVGEFPQDGLEDVEARARELSISMKNLRTIRITQVAKVHKVFVSSCPTFVQRGPQAVLWKEFLEHQEQCQHLSVGMPGLPQAFIGRFCHRAGAHLKSLELTHLMYNVGEMREERMNCECFRDCPNLQKLVLAGAPPHFGNRLDCTFYLDPPLILAGVREGFPQQLKQISVCNLTLTSEDAQFILVEFKALETAHLSRVGNQEPYGVPIETIRQVVKERKLKRLILLDSINGQIKLGNGIRVNPAGMLRILQVRDSRNDELVSWMELVKDSRTGYYEQVEENEFQNEENKLYH